MSTFTRTFLAVWGGALALTLLLGVLILPVFAEPSYTMNYQGKLADSTGATVADGTYQIVFKLYTQSSGGAAIWTETRSGGNEVQVTNGLFSVMLGSVSSLSGVNFNQPLYLGVTVEADSEMTPRKPIGSVPSAFEAKQVGGVASSSFLRSDAADSASGLLTFTGGLISSASTSIARFNFANATGTSLYIGGDRITDFVGTGLTLSGTSLVTTLGTEVTAGEIGNGDHGAFTYNSGSATLDNNVVTPNSILTAGQTDEYCLTYEATGTTFAWQTCGGLTSADIDTSAELAAILTDETGTGFSVFSASPTFTGGAIFAGATFTTATTTNFVLNGERFTDLTGTGLAISSNALTVSLGNNFITPDNILSTSQTDEYCLTYETGDTFEWQSCGGGSTFLALTDVPDSYTDQAVFFSSGGQTFFDADFKFSSSTNRLTVGTATFGTTGLSFAGAATTTLANNNPYAFTFATSTTARPLFRIDTTTGGASVEIGAAGGDVYIGAVGSASDLIFEESSTISGQGTNLITLGVSGDLFNLASGVKLGVASTTPWQEVSINGDIALTGRLFDSLASAGTSGMVLQTTGSATRWVATSSLGLSNSFSNSSQLAALLSDETGSGAAVFGTNPTLTGTQITYTSLTAARGLFLDASSRATTTALSAYLLNSITDETGSGALVFGTSPTFTTSALSPAFVSTNADPADAGVLRLGNAEAIAWEASPAGTDATLSVNASEQFVFTGTGALIPSANDGASLGVSGTAFSDLFLASGAVIDFAAGNTVLTHSAGILTVSTGDLRVTTAGTNAASVVTVGGTQTLTNKTWNGSVIGTLYGGTGVDTSGYTNGLIGYNSSAITDIDTESELETALGALDVLTVTSNDVSSANLLTMISDETGTGNAVFSTNPTLAGFISNASSTISRATFVTATTTNLVVNGERFTDLTGTGLAISSNALTVSLANDYITPNMVKSAGQTDEYCLTYESTATTWEWQTCGGGMSIGGAVTSGTTGSVLFVDGGNLAQDNAEFFFNNTTNRLGIGTTTPNYKLTVQGDINLSAATGAIYFDDVRYLYASSTNDSLVFGENAGATFTSDTTHNVAIGYEAGRYASTTWAAYNNIIGYQAGYYTDNGDSNIFGTSAGYRNGGYGSNLIGFSAGYDNSGSYANTIGYQAGYANTGSKNNIFGWQAGYSNTGDNSILIGNEAGKTNSGYAAIILGHEAGKNQTGSYNNIIGFSAGYSAGGQLNNLFGYRAGYSNTGDNNEFIGTDAGRENAGDFNQFIGEEAGRYNSATATVAIGAEALKGAGNYISSNNVAVGYQAGTIASAGADNNILIGYRAADNLTTGNNNIIIGYDIDNVTATADNRLNIGNLIFGTGLDGTGTTLSSGNIGIGTTTPNQKLTVQGNINLSAATGAIFFDDTKYIYASSTNDSISFGESAGAALTATGLTNVAIGYQALQIATTTDGAVAIGAYALQNFQNAAVFNTAIGYESMRSTNSGGRNTAVGFRTLDANTSGSYNSAFGEDSLGGNTTGTNNSAFGYQALLANTTGANNVVMGYQAMDVATTTSNTVAIGSGALGALITSSASVENTAIGYATLAANTYGGRNTAAGYAALNSNNTGSYNTAYGGIALGANTTGSYNIAIGYNSLVANTVGNTNVAVGYLSLSTATSTSQTTAIGYNALAALRTSSASVENTAVGYFSLLSNTYGGRNTAVGYATLDANTTGSYNSAFGDAALGGNTTGGYNVAFGYNALGGASYTASNNIAIGYNAGDNLTSGARNIIIGTDIDATSATAANTLNIGNTIFGINMDSTGTTVDPDARVGIATSSPVQELSVVGDAYFTGGLGVGKVQTTAGNITAAGLIVSQSGGGTHTGAIAFGTSPNQVIGANSSTLLDINAAGYTNVRISGNVGIGTSGPVTALANGTTLNTGAVSTAGINWQINEASKYAASFKNISGTGYGIHIEAGSATSRALVVETGYVGIGTTTPWKKLSVTGDAVITGAIYDSLASPGGSGECLTSTVTGTDWASCGSGFLTSADIDTSAELDTIVTDDTGSGALVFGTSPTFTTSALSPVFSSTAADPADAGVLRLGNAEVIGWEASPAGTDATLSVNASEQFVFTGTGALIPSANDGASLGVSGTAFSDLFLASGAVIDFAAGNTVLTHSAGILTVSTGDLRVTTAGTNAASVVTVGGSQTLTNKTLTSPAINGATLSGTISNGTFSGGTWQGNAIGIAYGGLGAAFTDPNADQIMFWDDSAGVITGIVTLTGAELTGTNLKITDVSCADCLTSIEIADEYVFNTGDSISGNLTFSGTTANISLGSNYLSGDGGDEGFSIDSFGNATLLGASSVPVTFNSTGGSHNLLQFSNSGTGRGGIGYTTFGSTGLGFWNAALSTVNLLVTDGGDVGINNTSPSYRLTVQENEANYAAFFNNDGNATNRSGIAIAAGLDDHTAAGSSILVGFFDGSADLVGSITFGSSAVQYNTTSDVRLKTNIVDTAVGIEQLMQVKVRDFNWKADADKSTLTHGFIAQELYEVYPDAVSVPSSANDMWMVDYSKLMPLVIAGVQDQQVQVVEQGATLGSLGEQLLTTIKSVADLEAAVSSGLSENYRTNDDTIEAGELVALDRDNDTTIKRAELGDEIFGVVSENAGVILGDGMSSAKPVALTGRVKVKVNDEGGDIKRGDAITLSSEAGIGTKATTTTRVIGTALEESDNDTDTIHIYVSPRTHFAHNETKALSDLFKPIENNDNDTLWGRITTLASNFVDGMLQVAGLRTRELCIEDDNGETCLTRSEIDQILRSSRVEASPEPQNPAPEPQPEPPQEEQPAPSVSEPSPQEEEPIVGPPSPESQPEPSTEVAG